MPQAPKRWKLTSISHKTEPLHPWTHTILSLSTPSTPLTRHRPQVRRVTHTHTLRGLTGSRPVPST
eukprot:3690599-Prymnesium_polylepis.1